MRVLVAYESKYGATQGIADRIGETLRAHGLDVDVVRAREVRTLDGYDAFVVGSAAYYGSWINEATQLVLRQRVAIGTRPLWLFSSGPVSSSAVDAKGNDVRAAAEPKTIADLRRAVTPRGHRVFFGALDPTKMGMAERIIASLPAFPGERGDFRDWKDIEAWAEQIARELGDAFEAAATPQLARA